ncbi:MAG: DUF4345 domain-containing protein [Cytophagales bacterium]|nr:DUF4345 domain-containing protein [Cytophagales bacterium]
MSTNKLVHLSSTGLILLSAASLLSVSFMAFANPQSVMDLVQVQLTSNDAFSSIRGVYGGVGLALGISLLYLMVKDTGKGLAFLCLLWGFYAASRIITIFVEGSLGDFGTQWLITESVLFGLAAGLLLARQKTAAAVTVSQ